MTAPDPAALGGNAEAAKHRHRAKIAEERLAVARTVIDSFEQENAAAAAAQQELLRTVIDSFEQEATAATASRDSAQRQAVETHLRGTLSVPADYFTHGGSVHIGEDGLVDFAAVDDQVGEILRDRPGLSASYARPCAAPTSVVTGTASPYSTSTAPATLADAIRASTGR